MLFKPESTLDWAERFIKRFLLTDVWHNGVKTNSHKQLNCKLRLTQLIEELEADSTSFSTRITQPLHHEHVANRMSPRSIRVCHATIPMTA